MKKIPFIFIGWIIAVIAIVAVLNIQVTTRYGVNFKVQTIKIPLYLKLIDFFDRHYNYNQLVKSIVRDAKTEEGRVMKIFEWTYKNIREVPEGMPIIDDHVWHIIVRGMMSIPRPSDKEASFDGMHLNAQGCGMLARITAENIREYVLQ